MAPTANHLTPAMLLFSLLFITSLDFTVGQVGVYFGRLGNNLPSAQRTVALYKNNNIHRMRLFDPDPATLQALGGTGIRLMLGVPNDHLQDLANCPDAATFWVRSYVLQYPNVTFRYIAVGNEIAPESILARFVLPAMQNMYRAIRKAGLGGQIQVSTSIKTDLLGTSFFPPQAGEFKCSVNWFIRPIIEFLRDTRSSLLVNVFPFYAYMNDMKNINLSFALLQPNSGIITGGVYYDNLFYVMYDAVDAAVERILTAAPRLFSALFMEEKLPTSDETSQTVSGTGVPAPPPPQPEYSVGNLTGLQDGPMNTVENARIYNNNLMRIVKTGTPRRPNRTIETYIVSMYDENLKPGPEYVRQFGIFLPNGQPKYRLRFH